MLIYGIVFAVIGAMVVGVVMYMIATNAKDVKAVILAFSATAGIAFMIIGLIFLALLAVDLRVPGLP